MSDNASAAASGASFITRLAWAGGNDHATIPQTSIRVTNAPSVRLAGSSGTSDIDATAAAVNRVEPATVRVAPNRSASWPPA